MFDDLDDPNPAPAGPGERAAVSARAARIRQRRTAWVAGSVSLVLAVVAGTAVGLREPARDRVVQSLDTTEPPASPIETTTPSPDPVVESETRSPAPPTTVAPEPPPTTEPPERTEEPEPERPVTPSPTATSTSTAEPFPGSEPDGKPGWSGGFSGCSPRETMLPEGGALPFPSVTAEIELPETMTTGREVEAKLVLTNTGSEPVAFDASGLETAVRNKATGQMGGDYWNDAILQHRIELGPGEKRDLDISFATTQCGDTREDDEPLPTGEYVFAAAFHWRTRSESGASGSGSWGVHSDGSLT